MIYRTSTIGLLPDDLLTGQGEMRETSEGEESGEEGGFIDGIRGLGG
jgi:hypothetical protein